MIHDNGCDAFITGNKDCNCSASTELYYIRDSRTVIGNCTMWWRVDGKGYTSDIREAWKVTRDKATRMCMERKTDLPYKVTEIDKIVRHHVDFQMLPKEGL